MIAKLVPKTFSCLTNGKDCNFSKELQSNQKGGQNRVGVSGVWGGGHQAGVAL